MTVKLSVIIWTVICFFILLFILKNLLFKPMLKFMDERRAIIEDAAKKRAKRELEAKETALNNQKLQKELLIKVEAENGEQLEKAHEKAEKLIAEQRRKHQENLINYKTEIESEHKELIESVSPQLQTLAELFVSGFVS